MLNRMVTLATQSANGTYDDTTDRVNLQKEVTALKDEIDRIADSSNFNGIQLLDGTQASNIKSSVADWGSAATALASLHLDFGSAVGKDLIGGKITLGKTTINVKAASAGASLTAVSYSGGVLKVGVSATASSIVKALASGIASLTGIEDTEGNSITLTAKASGTVLVYHTSQTTDKGKEMDALTIPELKVSAGLNLQIGDTSKIYNKMNVGINDMHCDSLYINDIDISDQDKASSAINRIKNAINMVSSTRGDLGAIQNRLEHTENNLSVMAENIQDAESTIRDTDVAEEMMSYTKNNILVQSAQAMLAQANTVPQGVLQLLQ
jgi:flagellin